MSTSHYTVTDLLFALPSSSKLIETPSPTIRTLTSQEAAQTLTVAVENVCDCFGVTIPTLVNPVRIGTWAMRMCEDAGFHRAMAFSNLAQAAFRALSRAEESKGYPTFQQHIFEAIRWAASGETGAHISIE